jgi:hypothetical protein
MRGRKNKKQPEQHMPAVMSGDHDDDEIDIRALTGQKSRRSEQARRMSAMLTSLGWIAAAIFILYHTQMHRVLSELDSRLYLYV